MAKSIIAVDCDDVLLPHFQDLAEWYNKEYGTHVTLADNNSDNLEVWGTATDEEAIRRVQKFFDSEAFRSAQPFKEAKQALIQLSSKYELIVATARDSLIEVMTREWLEQHFEDLFADVHFAYKFSLEGRRRDKSDILVETGASYLIDDSLDNIAAARRVGVDAIIFGDYPWNQLNKVPDGVARCKDWAAVLEYFDAKK